MQTVLQAMFDQRYIKMQSHESHADYDSAHESPVQF